MEPTIRVYSDAGLWIRELHFRKAGDRHAGHLHAHDHKTLIPHGSSITVSVDGEERVIDGPAVVLIERMKRHHLTANHDNAMAYCVEAVHVVEA